MTKVNITFLPFDEDYAIESEAAEVVVRDNGDTMVVDVAGPAGRTKYLVTGRRNGHVYHAGSNEAYGSSQRVSAQWARIGDCVVGKWRENNHQYLFDFSLTDDDVSLSTTD